MFIDQKTILWKWKESDSESHSVMSDSFQPHGLYSPRNSPGKNIGVGSCSLLQGIFPTQGSNSGVPHCRQILYSLSHHGSPRILEWVAYPFSSRSSWPRDWTGVSCMASGFFTNWAIREAHNLKPVNCRCNHTYQIPSQQHVLLSNWARSSN